MKSLKTYRHIQANEILSWPSLSIIRKILSFTECALGVNELALEHIKNYNMVFQNTINGVLFLSKSPIHIPYVSKKSIHKERIHLDIFSETLS